MRLHFWVTSCRWSVADCGVLRLAYNNFRNARLLLEVCCEHKVTYASALGESRNVP